MSPFAALAAASREVARLGLVSGTAGNLSLREGPGLLVTPTGRDLATLEQGDIVLLDAANDVAVGGRPTSEWQLHRAILDARPELSAVVHTHGASVMAAAALRRPIPAVHYTVIAAGGEDIPCAPYATPGSEALAAHAAAALASRDACLLAHHGAVAAGRTLKDAVGLALIVEELARTWLTLLAVTDAPPVLGADEMASLGSAWSAYRGSAT
ncbi:class II aldolase/adducin family protein [Elioraea rosea]|uniref:class II aldolase/adducin family protein n=1 Tax=Elioraea rosea TaxID=2492390 RepID=UPI001183B91C|nr:class II aldolase/adducin family protein [Elioraea rosea]